MVPLQNIDTLDTVLTCSLRVYSFLLPVIWTIMFYVELYLEDSKFVLLYKLHIDYSKYIIYIYIYIYMKCEGCTHFCEILYIYIYSQVHKYWDIDTILTFLALYTTTMDFK